MEASSEAYKGGIKNIADIGKERIRLAAAKVRENYPLTANTLDVGFRVLKIDTSNMQDVYYTPDEFSKQTCMAMSTTSRPDRTPEDLLFQVLLDWGVDLASPLRRKRLTGRPSSLWMAMLLAACFDTGVTDELVKEIAKRKPLRAVFRDASYGSDSVKINVEQIFKLLSPETEVKVHLAMKLRFKQQRFQIDAVDAVVDCFEGQPLDRCLRLPLDPAA